MSEEAKCKHCGKSKEEHSQRGICGGILSSCYSPAEPSPAPQTQPFKDGLEEMSIEELDGELRSHGLDPAELDRDMLGRLEARLKKYETGGETPPERFLEMLRQFRVAVGTAKPESEKEGEL